MFIKFLEKCLKMVIFLMIGMIYLLRLNVLAIVYKKLLKLSFNFFVFYIGDCYLELIKMF